MGMERLLRKRESLATCLAEAGTYGSTTSMYDPDVRSDLYVFCQRTLLTLVLFVNATSDTLSARARK